MSFRAGIRHIRVAVFVFCVAFMLITQAFSAKCDENQIEYNDITVRLEEQGYLPNHKGEIKYQYLDMVVRLNGAEPHTEYMIDFSKAEYTYMRPYEYEAKINPVSVTTDRNGSAEVSFALKHGQEFTICDLPEGTSYDVSEESDGYRLDDKGEVKNENDESSVQEISVEQIPGYEDSKEGKLNGKDVRISFMNTRRYPLSSASTLQGMLLFAVIGFIVELIMIVVLKILDYRDHRAQKKYEWGTKQALTEASKK